MRWIYPERIKSASFLQNHQTNNSLNKLYQTYFKLLFNTPLRKLLNNGAFSIYSKLPLKLEKRFNLNPKSNYYITNQ